MNVQWLGINFEGLFILNSGHHLKLINSVLIFTQTTQQRWRQESPMMISFGLCFQLQIVDLFLLTSTLYANCIYIIRSCSLLLRILNDSISKLDDLQQHFSIKGGSACKHLKLSHFKNVLDGDKIIYVFCFNFQHNFIEP